MRKGKREFLVILQAGLSAQKEIRMSDHFDWSSCGKKKFHISTALFSHTEESF